jgi:hypothetical protein
MRTLVLCLVTGVVALGNASARAATFVANDLTDAVDVAPGNGVCATARGTCTLRAAVQEANALAGADQVTLAAGVHELSLAGADEDQGATGDLDVLDDLTIAGANAYLAVIDANGVDRVLDQAPDGDGTSLTLRDLTLTGGDVDGRGGGVRYTRTLDAERIIVTRNHADTGGGLAAGDGVEPSLALSTSVVSLNTAVDGGGIDAGEYFVSSVELTIVIGNSAMNQGGGVRFVGPLSDSPMLLDRVTIYGNNVHRGRASRGGGIHGGGYLELDRSWVGHNLVGAWGAAPGGNGRGGGIYLEVSGQSTVTNTTIEGNLAAAAGAIGTQGLVDITHATIARNASTRGGALHAYDAGSFFLANTIVGENTPANCSGKLPLWIGTNLETSNESCLLDWYVLAGQLDALGYYGGPTRTIPPLPASGAIEGGLDEGVDVDQRGVARPQLAQFDLGAVEMQDRRARQKYTGGFASRPHRCDLDRNGRVDFADLDRLIAGFRTGSGGNAAQRLRQCIAACTHAGCPAVALIKKPSTRG